MWDVKCAYLQQINKNDNNDNNIIISNNNYYNNNNNNNNYYNNNNNIERKLGIVCTIDDLSFPKA